MSSFKEWLFENYDIESCSNVMYEKQKRNGDVTTTMYWNKDRRYPEEGEYVTSICAGGPCIFEYVAKVIRKTKGKRPLYDIEVLYTDKELEHIQTKNIRGFFLLQVEKKDNWIEFKNKRT